MKKYNTAPLPFMGQKRRFLKDFKEALKHYPSDATYVDLFGGSGLLSHTVKSYYPNATVIYNDFDNYENRIANISATNKLLADIRLIVSEYPKDKKLPAEVKAQILKRVKQEYYVDYITLSSSLLFSMNYANNYQELEKEHFYNVVRQSDYNADGYLEGVQTVSMDYRKLFHAYKSQENVIFLVDPPYLSTETGTYKNTYWKLSDYLDVLDVLNGGRYFYFTSNKSNIIELCNWISTRTGWCNPFQGMSTSIQNVSVNYSSSYTDIMVNK
jgi:site-specific DNA-adenine methylase